MERRHPVSTAQLKGNLKNPSSNFAIIKIIANFANAYRLRSPDMG